MDEVDQAQALEEAQRQDALRRLRPPRAANRKVRPRDCVRCGDPIPLRRLRAVPDTEHCIDCQAAVEGEI
jgi:phage/conjugal plasmid C-4 type zinc finger TraR family protein